MIQRQIKLSLPTSNVIKLNSYCKSTQITHSSPFNCPDKTPDCWLVDSVSVQRYICSIKYWPVTPFIIFGQKLVDLPDKWDKIGRRKLNEKGIDCGNNRLRQPWCWWLRNDATNREPTVVFSNLHFTSLRKQLDEMKCGSEESGQEKTGWTDSGVWGEGKFQEETGEN